MLEMLQEWVQIFLNLMWFNDWSYGLAATAGEKSLVFLPLFLAAAGIIVSIFGTFL